MKVNPAFTELICRSDLILIFKASYCSSVRKELQRQRHRQRRDPWSAPHALKEVRVSLPLHLLQAENSLFRFSVMSLPPPFFFKTTLDIHVKLIPSHKNVEGGRNGPGVALVSTHLWIETGKHRHLPVPAE